MNLEIAMMQSEDRSAINFGIRGWITVESRNGAYLITTEDRPSTPEQYDNLESVQKAVRLFNSETWKPRELDQYD